MNGEFDGTSLELNGGGYFKQDDDVFHIETSLDASNYISYHIEANVVSAVPFPQLFIFSLLV